MLDEFARTYPQELAKGNAKKRFLIILMGVAVILLFFVSLMIGSSHMNLLDSIKALFGQGETTNIRIVQQIRLPRAIAAMVAGAGLSIAGLIMQSTLKNPMASPSTLGVSNAAVFGANVSIVVFAGGFFGSGGRVDNYIFGANPFATSSIALIFALISTLLILLLCRIRSFSSETVVLAGLALGTVWTALTTLLQYYATDVGLSAAVIWTFGDLGRATFTTDWIMFAVVAFSAIIFFLFHFRYNALASDETVARSLGIHVGLLRFVSLFLASLITAVCVSYLGIIGFIGIICPHAMRRIIGNNHRFLIPASLVSGSLLLLLADIFSRAIGNGSSIPVGAITAILGGPFFIYLIFARKGGKA